MQMFQRLGLRSVLFTRQGALTGILTKMVRSLSLDLVRASSDSLHAARSRRTFMPTSTPTRPGAVAFDRAQLRPRRVHPPFARATPRSGDHQH